MPISNESFYATLGDLNLVSVTFRLLLSMLCGGILGIDRTRKRRPAGLRTYMLVCLGSALVMITNQYIAELYNGIDPARLGAQVISGIGFLGAGTIIVTRRNQVIGLTTAAGLWASACMGLAIGIGFYEGALIACVFIFIVMIVIHRFDSIVMANSRAMEVYVEFFESGKIGEFLNFLSSQEVKVTYLEFIKMKNNDLKGRAALITIRLPKRTGHICILQRLGQIEGVRFIEEV